MTAQRSSENTTNLWNRILKTFGLGIAGTSLGAVLGGLFSTVVAAIRTFQGYQSSPVIGTGWEPYDIILKALYVLSVGLIGVIAGALIAAIPSFLGAFAWSFLKKDKQNNDQQP